MPSAPDWGERATAAIDEILLDHAHCEKKAASTALSLLFRYPERSELVLPLSELAREELSHFEAVVAQIRARGREFLRLRPSAYASDLVSAVRTHEPARLVDTLVCCALIEARSCERMQLLARALRELGNETALADLYEGLLASEARHHATYLELARACGLVDDEDLRTRTRELAVHEASVIDAAPLEARMHSRL